MSQLALIQSSGPERTRPLPERVDGQGRKHITDDREPLSARSRLSSAQRAILEHVGGMPTSARGIARKSGFVVAATRRHLAALCEAGVVVEDASGWRRR